MSSPGDAAAPARFRALAEDYRVLGDPARRAAYDRAAGYGPRPRAASPDGPPARVPAAWEQGPGDMAAGIPVARVPGAPLWAGPVRVEVPYRAPAADPDRGLFSISVAAELAGLHPQTLRIYEREGLVDPARSPGGTRRYSRRDIEPSLTGLCF